MTATERPSNRTEELRATGLRRIVHITHDAREYVPAADYDALAAEVDRFRARTLDAAPADPVVSAECWRRAVEQANEYYATFGARGDFPIGVLAWVSERADALAREGK